MFVTSFFNIQNPVPVSTDTGVATISLFLKRPETTRHLLYPLCSTEA